MGIPEERMIRSRSGFPSMANGSFKPLPVGGAVNVSNEDELLELLSSGDIKEVDCCFADPLGHWHHCSFHPSMVCNPQKHMGCRGNWDSPAVCCFYSLRCSLAMVLSSAGDP